VHGAESATSLQLFTPPVFPMRPDHATRRVYRVARSSLPPTRRHRLGRRRPTSTAPDRGRRPSFVQRSRSFVVMSSAATTRRGVSGREAISVRTAAMRARSNRAGAPCAVGTVSVQPASSQAGEQSVKAWFRQRRASSFRIRRPTYAAKHLSKPIVRPSSSSPSSTVAMSVSACTGGGRRWDRTARALASEPAPDLSWRS
jgi:hypothetical protein